MVNGETQKGTAIGTIVRDIRKKKAEKQQPTPQQTCEARGGTWDSTTNTCSLPTTERPTPETAPITTQENAPALTKVPASPPSALALATSSGTKVNPFASASAFAVCS